MQGSSSTGQEWRGYAVAAVLCLLAAMLREALQPWLHGQAPFILLLIPPVLAAWYGGGGPGFVALLIGAVLGQLLFVPPRWSLLPAQATDWIRLALFLLMGGLSTWLIATRHAALRRLQRDHEQLQQARNELELRERRLQDALHTSRTAEADLRHSRAQLQQLFETNLLGIVFWRTDRRVVEANDEVLRIWGRTREEFTVDGLWLDALTPPEFAPQDRAALQRLRTEGRVPPMEKQYVRPDGSRVWVLVGAALTGEDEGVAFVLDISAQKEAELATRANAAMFQSLADNIAQLAWMTDATGYITWYNRRWFEYTGTDLQQMKSWGWQWAHHPEHVERVLTKFRRHMASGEPWEDTFPLRGADGQYRWFLSHAFPLRDHAGRIVAWFGTNTDVDAQRRAEQQLREADRRKDEFIAVLAHELRNPLAPVRNAVEILKRLDLAEPRLGRVSVIVDRQVSHMARLIDDLLDVSRIARGKLTLRKEPCDLSDIVCNTADDYRATLAAAQQQLHVTGCDEATWVEGDPVRIAQMVGNLLTNAARFSNGPGQVRVECSADRATNTVRIGVSDTGIGIEPELLVRLFDPFAQAAQDIARSKGGLGLGLALTKGLVELHGGGVLAESDGSGRGARFTITLPLARAERASRPAPLGRAGSEPLRILVIEDNQDAANTLGELLQLGGHEVQLAYDGASGIDLARRLRPDVVISDIGLPGTLSGYDVGRALRAESDLDGVYLIALSGYADHVARGRAAEAGFDTHLAKPPDIGALETALVAVKARSAA
ncbi:ATP-binding protein [Ramlibacter algicola]|uniref:histidine kinase n=1 Tax=Ramlibacter algicola TaxID=2795217 RepID=A0A934PZ76_9BURK|nr:ATP-binding protein [Ramlibacter algicola]MBK0391364.1 PAS domain S-box protein [Ramlibacter algicola]